MFFGGKGTVGLDIGSGYLKLVQLKDTKEGYELELFDMLPLPPELIVDGSIIDSLRLVDSLKELARKAKIRAKDVTISIAGHSSVIIKRVSLPEMSEDELYESIKFEAEQYIPFDIDDVDLDFQILGPKEEPGQMDVILVAVKKDIVNEYLSVVKEAGLNCQIVDVNSFALENIYEINYEIEPEKNVALVNIGANTINMNILKGGISVFTRDSAVGSNLHTEVLQREFNLAYEVAERLKRGEPVENVTPQDAFSVMELASEEIISEVNRSLEYFHEDIHEIVLSGGCALIRDFPNLLAEKIRVETKLMQPFKNIKIVSTQETRRQMIKVNLLPLKRKKKPKPLPSFLVITILITVVICILMAYLTFFFNSRLSVKKKQFAANETKIAELKEMIKTVEDFEQRNKTFKERNDIIEQLSKNKSLPVKILDEFSALLPNGIWLQTMSIAGGTINLEGYGFTNNDIVSYVDNIKNSRMFTDVYLQESKSVEAERVAVYMFKLTCRLKV